MAVNFHFKKSPKTTQAPFDGSQLQGICCCKLENFNFDSPVKISEEWLL